MYISPAYTFDPQRKPLYPCTVDWNHPLSRGLVGCWPLNEGVKAAKDITGINGTGSYVDGSVYNATLGEYGAALYGYNTYKDYVLLRNSRIVSGKADGTVIVRFVTWSGTYSSAGGSIYVERASSGNDLFKIGLTELGGTIQFIYRNTAGTLDVVNFTQTASTFTKYTVAITKKGTTVNKYVNGQLDSAPATLIANDIFTNSGTQARLGSDPQDGATKNGLNGMVFYAYLYNRALSDSEIYQIYHYPYCFIKPGIQMPYWIAAEEEVYYRSPMPTFRPYSW